MFIYYLWLYLIYLLKIVPTFTYALTDCDLIPMCMNEYNISTVKDLSNITCEKSSPCDVIDLSSSSKFQNSLNIALEKLNIIKQDNGSSLVQLALTASLPQLQNEGSFLFQIYLGENFTCYNFYIPFSSLSYRRFVLPCLRLKLSSQPFQQIFVHAYFKEFKESKYETINIQGATFVLEDTSTVQVLRSGFMNITSVVDKRNIYVTSNVDSCASFYNISIIESSGDDLCNPLTQKTVCRWTSNFKSPHLCLNCSRNNIKPSQAYCIYSHFFARKMCEYTYPVETVQMTFFKIPPEKFMISQSFCEHWNASILSNVNSKKEIQVQFFPWNEYDNCFVSYEFRLYAMQYPGCIVTQNQSPIRIINVTHKQGVVTNKTFTDIPNGNYCFLITPCDVECGSAICRSRLSLSNKKIISIEGYESTEDVGIQNYPLHVVIAGILLLLITVPTILCCIIKKCRRVKDFDDFEMNRASYPLLMPPIKYIFHCEDIVDHVRGFAEDMEEILKPTLPDIKVHTFNEKFDEILRNSDRWFKNNLKWECDGRGPTCSSNMRLIIAVSDRYVELIDQLDNNNLQMPNKDRLFHEFLNYMTNIERFRNDHFHVIKVCFDARFDSEPEKRGICARSLRDIASFCSLLLHCKRTRNTCCSVKGTCYNLKNENRKKDFYLALKKGREETS